MDKNSKAKKFPKIIYVDDMGPCTKAQLIVELEALKGQKITIGIYELKRKATASVKVTESINN